MPKHTAVIAGATGAASKRLVEVLLADPDWRVVGLSRRPPKSEHPRMTYLGADLTDPANTRAALAKVPDATHLFYTARATFTDATLGVEDVEGNAAMVRNLVDAGEAEAKGLQHIHLVEGTKWYGMHLGGMLTPAREDDPRHMPPNFYYDQEDFLRERQRGKNWNWTIFRPPAVCGFAVGSPMNTILVIGLYAAISRELGLALRFPGALGHLKDACDAQLLAKAVHWAGGSASANNQIFNVSNGECFLWEQVFPKIAEVFGMEHATPHAMSLGRVMADKSPVWDRMVAKYNLKPYRYDELVKSWEYADFTFRYRQAPFESLQSTIKIRQAGFSECIDTQAMFVAQLRKLQRDRILPQ